MYTGAVILAGRTPSSRYFISEKRIKGNIKMSSTAEQIWAAFGQDCDLYEVIGVDSKATDKEITRAYRKLALRYVSGSRIMTDDAAALMTDQWR